LPVGASMGDGDESEVARTPRLGADALDFLPLPSSPRLTSSRLLSRLSYLFLFFPLAEVRCVGVDRQRPLRSAPAAHIRRGSGYGRRKPPRSGWHSDGTQLGLRGRRFQKSIQCHKGGSAAPGEKVNGESSVAASGTPRGRRSRMRESVLPTHCCIRAIKRHRKSGLG